MARVCLILMDNSKSIVVSAILLCVSISLLQIPAFASFASHSSQDVGENSFGRSLKQQSEQLHEVHCSRERSRAAWKIIEEYLMPFLEKEKYQLSKKCRLHPDNDMFRDQEQHKRHVDINEWQCGYCKKSFYAEKFLDHHLDNRHFNLINVNDSKCLADLCGALHCDLVMDFPPPKTKCNPAAGAKNRHLCESLAGSCFPLRGGPSASRLHEFFLRQFCDAHTCSGGRKPFSRGGKKRTSIFYICISIVTLILLPLFYGFIYMYQKGLKRGTQDLRRVPQTGRKKKPS